MRILLSLAVFGALASSAAADFVLVQTGVAKATIVVSKEVVEARPDPDPAALGLPQPAASKVAAAARDLQEYVAKISGVKLSLVADDQEPKGALILVGKSRLTKVWDDKIPGGLTPGRDEEGLVIIAKGERLLLAGNDEGPYHGTEYAVAELLDRFGVRWYMPGEFGDVVPSARTLVFKGDEVRQKPSFKIRNWWGAGPPANELQEYRWKIRNKMNPVMNMVALPGDSSASAFLPPDTEQTAPEALALGQDGKRIKTLPNLTHPKAVEVVLRAMKEQFGKDPLLTSVGIAPDDGLPRDFDPATVKRNLGFPDLLGQFGVPAETSCSEEWIDFVNRVAREVRAEFPDRIITTNAYANRNTPPEGVAVEKNVWIMLASIWSDTIHAYDNPRSWQTVRQGRMIQRWCGLRPNVFMYDYSHAMLTSAGTPVPLSRKHRRDMPLLKQWGVVGHIDECRSILAESGIYPRYLRARLMWDVSLDVDSLLAEYFAAWYGPSARPARAFWDALEKVFEETRLLGHEDRILPYVYTPELLAELETHAAQAEKLAEGDQVKLRVRADRLILEHLKGYMTMTRSEWAADFAAAAREAEQMLAQRTQLQRISPFFFFIPDNAEFEPGFYFWGLYNRRDYYKKLADKTGGAAGELVAVLAETTPFRTDPRDEGRFAGWQQCDFAAADWKPIKTTTPFYLQGYLDETGYPYLGAMWYRFTVDVPATAAGNKVLLYIPTVETQAHVWVNGQFVGHRPHRDASERPNDVELDVTNALRPGAANTIALRVHTGGNAASAASGMLAHGPGFLYSPK